MTDLSKCLAHSLAGGPQAQWHRLLCHLDSVAAMASGFACAFKSDVWARLAGCLHDLGKAHPDFQAYLLRENGLDASEYDGEASGGRVNHSGAGAVLAMEKWPGPVGRTLAYLCAGHHAGLPDWNSEPTANAALCVRLETEKPVADGVRGSVAAYLSQLPANLSPPSFVKADGYHLWVRMLFSCLTDADFLDTEAFMGAARAAARPQFPSLRELKVGFDTKIGKLAQEAVSTPVNAVRQEVLAACRRAAQSSPGLFSLTVPTGGGKTLSATAFALDHAARHDKRRIIYVIPYTSIIEQTASTLRDFLGNDNVVEHHSNLSPERETLQATLAAENWDAPIVVTTSVQFFESLYAAKSGRCRKLHNITESVVILDEAQLLPPEWLIPCVDVLVRLIRDYGVSAVLSTATQPALPDPAVLTSPHAAPTLLQAREIIPDVESLYRRLRRTRIRMPSDMTTPRTWPDLATELCRHKQVLCIVNRRQDCRELYQAMPTGTVHLSALMCGEHRSRVIAEIKYRLKTGKPVRVVSTQLVEAGVDMDFPVVYRALAGLDSIAQAAGRCNREGRLSGLGDVHVFIPPKPSPSGLLRKGEDTTRELAMVPGFDPDMPEEYKRYFGLYYSKVNDTGQQWLTDSLTRDAPLVQFRTAAEEFRLIPDMAVPIIVRYRKSPEFIERLRRVGPARDIMRRLQRYTVSVPRYHAERLVATGQIEQVHPDILCQSSPKLYDDSTGLDIFSDGIPSEALVI